MIREIIDSWLVEKTKDFPAQRSFLMDLKGYNSAEISEKAAIIHKDAFSKIDCMVCANCCKTTPALLNNRDIKRIAKFLKITPKSFRHKYVIEDFSGELSFRKVPCVFLEEDNKCSVYEVRPESCRDYPHSDGKDFVKRSKLHQANLSVCPAVFYIVDSMKSQGVQ